MLYAETGDEQGGARRLFISISGYKELEAPHPLQGGETGVRVSPLPPPPPAPYANKTVKTAAVKASINGTQMMHMAEFDTIAQ